MIVTFFFSCIYFYGFLSYSDAAGDFYVDPQSPFIPIPHVVVTEPGVVASSGCVNAIPCDDPTYDPKPFERQTSRTNSIRPDFFEPLVPIMPYVHKTCDIEYTQKFPTDECSIKQRRNPYRNFLEEARLRRNRPTRTKPSYQTRIRRDQYLTQSSQDLTLEIIKLIQDLSLSNPTKTPLGTDGLDRCSIIHSREHQ